jgi:hypothetical protein
MKVFAYIDPKLNILCCALLKEAIPFGINVVELDVDKPDDVVYDGTQIRLKTQDEQLKELKQKKLNELAMYVQSSLQPTDYIFVKIFEAQVTNDNNLQALQTKYATQLQQRASVRQWNENIKQAINNATTIDQLLAIKIEYVAS